MFQVISDTKHNIVYIKLRDEKVSYSEELNDVIWADYGSDKSLVGVQLFDVAMHQHV